MESSLIPSHLVSGFGKTGIHSENRIEILQQLSGRQKDPGGTTPTISPYLVYHMVRKHEIYVIVTLVYE